MEVDFLHHNGLNVVHAIIPSDSVVSPGDVIVDLNSYPERMDPLNPDVRLCRRNGCLQQRRSIVTVDAKKHIANAEYE